jgi:microcystin-dependent protein
MATPFLGEIKLVAFGYPPNGWALCNGQTLPINQYPALFSLMGTTFGGNGTTTFQLPNLQGMVIVHQGTSPAKWDYTMGHIGGLTDVALNAEQIPLHSHSMYVSNVGASQLDPNLAALAQAPASFGDLFGPTRSAVLMPAQTVQATGANLPHENRMPYLVLNYVIALQGIFPTRN